jgi:hypothetical protein
MPDFRKKNEYIYYRTTGLDKNGEQDFLNAEVN